MLYKKFNPQVRETKQKKIKLRYIAALTLFTLLLVSNVSAVVHNINTSFDYSTVQEAIDNVSTLSGHTLTVDPGVYTENVVVNKSLTIKSTSGNPSNTIINASVSSSNVISINVDNVTISGFTIKDASASSKAGIYINNTHYCNISNNNLLHNVYGIHLYYAENNTLTNNTANNNTYGVELYYSLRNNLTNITANSNSNSGFYLYASYNNRFLNSRADYNTEGIYFSYASYNWVDNSSFRNNSGFDIGLGYTSDPWWCPNYLSNVTGSGGRPIGYYYSPSNISNMNFSELILCNADNSTITNVRVETYDTTKTNGVMGLLVDNSCFINISSNYNDRGMKFRDSHYNNFSGIEAEYSKWDGVRFDDSTHNIIKDSFFNNTELSDGLALYTSHNNTVSGVVADSNTGGYGIYLQDSRDNSFSSLDLSYNHEGFQLAVNSSYNNFTDVIAEGNTLCGGYISPVFGSSDSNIMDNISARSNGWYGIYLKGVSFNIIRNSSIENNTLYGIYLSNASNNNITNCTIINPGAWDFYSASSSTGNIVRNTRINQTKVSFTGLDIALKSTLNPPADPNEATNISKYLNITNNSAGSWIHLNISYLPSDLGGMNESKLKLFRYSGTTWQLVPGSAVNTVDDFVYANITSFSTFAPMVSKNLQIHNLNTGLNYSTIQDAINNANTLNGHTLSVDPGIYTENVVVNKSLIIKSASGNSSDTIVNASSASTDVVSITADDVLIANLTLRGADGGMMPAHGVKVSANNCTLLSNKLHHNGVSLTLSAHYNYSKIINNEIYSNKYLGTILIDLDGRGHYVFNNSIHSNDGDAIALRSDNCLIENNTIISNAGRAIDIDADGGYNRIKGNYIEDNEYGIYLAGALNNNITNCTIINSSLWDFYSTSGSADNLVKNTLINQTKVSFTGLDIALKSTLNPPADPNEATNISKYLNITNNSAGSWIHLNISYLPSDLGGMNESKLKLFRYSGTTWQLVPGSAVNTVDDFVYANITSFSTFAPMVSKNLQIHNLNTGLNYSTIQDAINNANTLNGHTLSVDPGIYTENVVVNKSLIIKSASGNSSDTIVNAFSASTDVVSITADDVLIANLTLTGADGGMMPTHGVKVSANNCTLLSNKLHHNGVSLTLSAHYNYSKIINNEIYSNGFLTAMLVDSYGRGHHIFNNSIHSNDGDAIDLNAHKCLIENNSITSNVGRAIDVSGSLDGEYNTIKGDYLKNNQYGIYLSSALGSNITNCTIVNSSAWDFYSASSSTDNIVRNTRINQTKVSFTGLDIALKSNLNPPADPSGATNATNISKYLNITNNSAGSWIHLNISYLPSDLGGMNESKLRLFRYAGASWQIVPGSAVNTVDDFVYANITSFSTFAPMVVEAESLQVHNLDTGLNYSTIQDAINNANTLNGHTLSVDLGTYVENVVVSKSLTIRSTSGNPSDTIVNASSSSSNVILINVDNVTISGFTITDASASDKAGVYLGNNVSHCNVSHNIVSGNYHGIYLNQSSNNSVMNNNASGNIKYGIYLDASDNNSVVNNNASENDYGICLVGSNNNSVMNNNASYNHLGIGLMISSGYNDLIGNTASDNEVHGVYLYYMCDDNLLVENTVNSNNWSGIYLMDSSYNTIQNNTAEFNAVDDRPYDAGITIESFYDVGGNNTVVNNTLNSNCGLGGILICSSSGNNLTGNTVNLNTYGIYLKSTTGFIAEAIGLSMYNTITNNTIIGNNDTGITVESLDTVNGNCTTVNNTIYNNFFNNTNNVKFNGTVYVNYWNTSKTLGTSIIGGPYLGGNFWAHPNGSGFSETHNDFNSDGICEAAYDLGNGNIDYLPLTSNSVNESSRITRALSNTSLDAGGNLTVTLTVQINGNESDYLIDEIPPGGAMVIDSGGGNTSYAGHIRWAVLENATPVVYTYIVVPTRTGNHSFNGTYMFEGMSNETLIEGDTDVEVTGTAFGINLSTGWNAISLVLNKSYTAESLLDEIEAQGGDCTEIDRWHFGGWNTHLHNVQANNFTILQGRGYYVKCSGDSIWSQVSENLKSPVPVDLSVGWNALAMPYSTINYTAESLLDEIEVQGGSCSEIDRWLFGGWNSHLHNVQANNFTISAGQGYYVKCNGSSTWTPN